ncbi:MAG: VCBS repeat-containing protein, partial [Verrucomicrobia bacterium]|nr:VCBS repeat-containing protein [Verrucomicrobiota bacterium]
MGAPVRRFHRDATVAVADFNGDGRSDVALAPSELAGQRHRLSWFEAPANPRTPSWREHRLIDPIEAVIHSRAAADFDRDGQMDIAFAERHQGADPDDVGVLLNRGQAHPWENAVVSTTGSHGLQLLDVDGNGAPDLFGANWSGPRQNVQLWHNLAGSPGRASAGGVTPVGAAQKVPRAEFIAWPLKVSRDGRYLVDQDEQPFLLVGDSPWSLIVVPNGVTHYYRLLSPLPPLIQPRV